MRYFFHFVHNNVLIAAILSWVCAQIIKTLLTLCATKRFDPERILGAGGMPSAHSAMVCALFMGVARTAGLQSPEFALAFAFACVVMYDAMGVRRAAGEQARVLNRLMEKWRAEQAQAALREHEAQQAAPVPQKELKEYLGHTPMEVLAGAMLGIVVSLLLVP